MSIPKNVSNEEVNLEKSLKYLKLPRFIGIFPETKEDITASIGPYGPYLKHGKKFISLKEDDVSEVGINRAIDLIQKNLDEKISSQHLRRRPHNNLLDQCCLVLKAYRSRAKTPYSRCGLKDNNSE